VNIVGKRAQLLAGFQQWAGLRGLAAVLVLLLQHMLKQVILLSLGPEHVQHLHNATETGMC